LKTSLEILKILKVSQVPLRLDELTQIYNAGLSERDQRSTRFFNAMLFYLRRRNLIERRGVSSKFEYSLTEEGNQRLIKLLSEGNRSRSTSCSYREVGGGCLTAPSYSVIES